MASNRLHTHDTPRVAVCNFHLRKIFWDERILTRLRVGDLYAECSEIKTRKERAPNAPPLEDSPFTQEFVVFDPASDGNEIARCQQFLTANQIVLGASGWPDPKQICVNGLDYHQKGKKECEHCNQGLPSEYEKDIQVWENYCNEANTAIRRRP